MASRIRKDGEQDRRFSNHPGPRLDNKNIHGLDSLLDKLNAIALYVEEDAPVIIGVEAVKHFKESFEKEGFTNTSLTKWAPRKSMRMGGTNSQKILSKTGELADAIEYRVEGKKVIISNDKPYAEIHNDGGVIEVTPAMRKYFWAMYYLAFESGEAAAQDQWKAMALAKRIKIPARPYIGESEELNQKIVNKILSDLNRICQS